ncbi:MAG TPA: NAD(P)/FAD-dependent oxidoreductase [Candidatus Angelobacter sp.]
MAEGTITKLHLPQADAIVVGSGPNGLAAAIRMAQAGWSVLVLEGGGTAGGGVRSAALTLPGFIHDVCSSVYPLAVCSPFFRALPLEHHGLQWAYPPAALAHPLDDGPAAVLHSSLKETAETLGSDAKNYQRLMEPLVARWQDLLEDILAPPRLPRHAFLFAKFGKQAIRSATGLANARFKTERARAFFAGMAAHAILPLENLSTAGVGLMLAILGHAVGWPFVRGGAQQLTNALVSLLQSLGGQIITGCAVETLDQLPPARAVLLDVTPRQLLKIAAGRLPDFYSRKLARYRYGMGCFKLDWALHQPIPWRAPECQRAGTIHLGGTLAEISDSERSSWKGQPTGRPYVLLSQPSLFDPTRTPEGKHTAWAYCHVPNGYAGDRTAAIEGQIERFAPGFRDCIAARSVLSPADLENDNPNLVGGDIAGGAADLNQLFFRPTASLYRVPIDGVYLCSSSTPPGAGVHGMCGYFAAEMALRENKKAETHVSPTC